MDNFFKRSLIFFALGFVVLLSFLIARGINKILGGVLVLHPKIELKIDPVAGKYMGLEQISFSEKIIERNLLNITFITKELKKEKKEEEKDKDDKPSENCDNSIDAVLFATFISEDPEWSMAGLIDSSSKVLEIVRMNATYHEGILIKEIMRDRIYFEKEGKLDCLEFGGTKKVKTEIGKGGKPGPSGKKLKSGVKQIKPDEYIIDKGMVEEQLGDLNNLATQARISPVYQNNKYIGFRFRNLKKDSLLNLIGINNGDIVQEINGQAIDSPQRAMALLDTFKQTTEVKLKIMRFGKVMNLSYHLK